jgi:ABC-2 type transport system ATP-binding protein
MSPDAIHVDRLTKTYRGGIRALDGLSLRVPQGSIFGLLGPNGAGKSTLLKILTTLLRLSSGSASVMGVDVTAHPLQARKQICVVLQENAVEQFLSVQDNFRTYGRFHRLDRRQIDQRMDRVMELFGLREERHQKVIDLSGGYKRRVQVAKVFMSDAPVVFLDEATTGMDPINKRATLEAIAAEAKRGRTVFLTTHILDEAEQLCDTIMFIDKGRSILEGDLFSIKAMAGHHFDVRVTFDTLSDETLAVARSMPHRSLSVVGTTVIVKLDASVVAPGDLLAALSRTGNVTSYEVHAASLEDIFLRLLGEGDGDA